MKKDKIGNVDMRRAAARVLSVLVMCALIFTGTAVPNGAYAASKKAKYSISVNNINSNTVLRKGTTLRIQASATVTKNGVKKSTPVKYKSSKKKIASVSSKGKIKAKRKGTTYITVYCKNKKSKKKKIKIRVGTPASSISVSGSNHMRKGRSATFKASVNKAATNKNVSWWSDNPAVATVSSSGKVTGKSSGSCNIYATAKDGSGVSGVRTVYIHQFTKADAKWIAHRGLHTSATENTKDAFEAAGRNGNFWGCECDIWSTQVVTPAKESLPTKPEELEQSGSDSTISGSGEPVPTPDAVIGEISALGLQGPLDANEKNLTDNKKAIINDNDKMEAVKTAFDHYKLLSDEQKYQVWTGLKSGEGDEAVDGLSMLFDAVVVIAQYDSIGFAINHDDKFSGNNTYIKNMTRSYIEQNYSYVCFLQGFLDSCKNYGMVPVIEIKEKTMADKPMATQKLINMLDENGLLDKSVIISFQDGSLSRAKEASDARAAEKHIAAPETYYLFQDDPNDKTNIAISKGYTGISVAKGLLNSSLYNKARSNNLKVGTWTYYDTISDDAKLFSHLLSGAYDLAFATVDYNIFK